MARGQEALNLGLLGQDACLLPRRIRPPPAMFSRSAHDSRSGLSPTEQGSSAHSRVALEPCVELAYLGVCLFLQLRVS